MKRERLKELDILRAIAFIFVVEQHTISNAHYTIYKILYTLAKPAAAVFLCISGISLCYVYLENFNWEKYYIKRAIKILIPYMVWSLIYLYIYGKSVSLANLLVQVMAGNAYYHLWYMGMTIRLFVYFPIILLIAKKVHKQDLKLRIVILITVILSYYEVSKYNNVIANNISFFIFKNPTEIQQRIINISPLFWFLYFVLGLYIAFNYKFFKKTILKFKVPVIGIYILLFIYSYLNEINKIKFSRSLSLLYYVFTILLWYIISVGLTDKNKIYTFFNFIGKYSFAGYMVHLLVVRIVFNQLSVYLPFNYTLVIGILTWILTSVTTPLLVKLITFIPYTVFITGIDSVHDKKQILTLKSVKDETINGQIL